MHTSYFKVSALIGLFCQLFTPIKVALAANTEFPIAKVVLVKGDVSVLPPHTKDAHTLKMGEMLMQDSSIFVNGKGFTKIKFIDDSIVTLGPNSKMVVQTDQKKESTLVELMTGKIRAVVKESQDKDKKKFFVKTQSASMGVRGTDFQVTYEPKATRATLLTYDGRVDMKKMTKKDLESLRVKDETAKQKELDKMLAEDSKKVEKGDFSNVTTTAKSVAEPVKISPVQFALLKRDDSLGAVEKELTKVEKKEIAKEVKELKKEFAEDIKKRGEDPNKSKDLGVIDTKTGFYVPPVNEKENLILGKIDDNGEFVPPEGVKVDTEKGLIAKSEADEKIKDIVKKVNKEIEVQTVPVGKKRDEAYNRYFLDE